MTANEFINKIAPIAIYQAAKHQNKIFASVCIAQACLESGYGSSTKMIKANAVFGIKVGKSAYHFGNAWKGKAYSTKTKECYDGKSLKEITDLFRAYNSIQESIEDYFDMLCTASRYKNALNQKTPLLCIQGIQKGPYATDPNYVSKVMQIINSNNLTRFDGGNVSVGNVNIPNTNTNIPSTQKYVVGKVYTTNTDLNIREQPFGAKMKYECITENAKQHAKFDDFGQAILKKGTRVTCKAISKQTNSTWVLIPSGWICAVERDKVYIE